MEPLELVGIYAVARFDQKNDHLKYLILTNKTKKKIKEYQTFVLKSIFQAYEQKEYKGEIKKIVQKNEDNIQAFLKVVQKRTLREHA